MDLDGIIRLVQTKNLEAFMNRLVLAVVLLCVLFGLYLMGLPFASPESFDSYGIDKALMRALYFVAGIFLAGMTTFIYFAFFRD